MQLVKKKNLSRPIILFSIIDALDVVVAANFVSSRNAFRPIPLPITDYGFGLLKGSNRFAQYKTVLARCRIVASRTDIVLSVGGRANVVHTVRRQWFPRRWLTLNKRIISVKTLLIYVSLVRMQYARISTLQ